MIERPDGQLAGYEHRKEWSTWKEPRCHSKPPWSERATTERHGVQFDGRSENEVMVER